MGRLVVNRPPIVAHGVSNTPIPCRRALVLTAIVISFGMTALIVVLALRGFLESGPIGSCARPGGGVRGALGPGLAMNGLIIVPILLPAVTAPFLVLALRRAPKLQRRVSLVATALLWPSACGSTY
jgi:hypothetical protein